MGDNGEAMTREEWLAYVEENGHSPGQRPRPWEHNRKSRNKNPSHEHHSRGPELRPDRT